MTFFIQNILRLNKYYYKLRQNKYVLYILDFDIFRECCVLCCHSFILWKVRFLLILSFSQIFISSNAGSKGEES